MVVIGIWIGALIFAILVAKASEYSQEIEREEIIKNMRERERSERQKKEIEYEKQQKYMYEQYVEYKKYILPPIKEKITEYFIKYPLLLEIYYKMIRQQEKFNFNFAEMEIPREYKDAVDKAARKISLEYEKEKKDELEMELQYYKGKANEMLSIKNGFKNLLWDFFYDDAMEGRNFEIYKSEMLIKYQKLYEYYGIVVNQKYKVTEDLDWQYIKKISIKYLDNFYINSWTSNVHISSLDGYVGKAHKYACILNIILKANKDIEANDDLITIYENLSLEDCEESYIHEKIYSLYKELYEKEQGRWLDKIDIKLMLSLYDKNSLFESDNDYVFSRWEKEASKNKVKIFKNKIMSKNELIEAISNNVNGKENDRILIKEIVDILRMQKELEIDTKFDIIKNVDQIINELYKIVKVKKQEMEKREKARRRKEAERERDRLLKGDLSKENKIKREKEELELDSNNIKDGFEFENYVANLYKKLGYTIEQITKKSGDQGADVVATKDGKTYVIQAKYYGSPVGNYAVQEVLGAIGMYKADKGIVITNSTFTKSAIELANANNIELVDGDGIERYKRQILAKL